MITGKRNTLPFAASGKLKPSIEKLDTASPKSVADEQKDNPIFLEGYDLSMFKPITPISDGVKAPIQPKEALDGISSSDGYDSEDLEELSSIFSSTVVFTDRPRDGAQSTFREGVVREFWTKKGMEIRHFPTTESKPSHFVPIGHGSPPWNESKKRKQPHSGF